MFDAITVMLRRRMQSEET